MDIDEQIADLGLKMRQQEEQLAKNVQTLISAGKLSEFLLWHSRTAQAKGFTAGFIVAMLLLLLIVIII